MCSCVLPAACAKFKYLTIALVIDKKNYSIGLKIDFGKVLFHKMKMKKRCKVKISVPLLSKKKKSQCLLPDFMWLYSLNVFSFNPFLTSLKLLSFILKFPAIHSPIHYF